MRNYIKVCNISCFIPGTKVAGKMPLTQEKRLDSNFSNNNDHSYLHKKFKKMASTVSVFSDNLLKGGDTRQKEANITQIECNSSISNGSIAAAHPEIEKIKGKQDKDNLDVQTVGKNVQTNINHENSRLSNLNNIIEVSGQTSFTDEFSNKTENHENDFIREAYNGVAGGRYICPYCKLSCAKPSVLEKHIRAHTNERPFPCVPCGFAFKTKSNLYKHNRSRTHALKLQGTDSPVTLHDEELSGSSESDTPTSVSETGSDVSSVRFENFDCNKFSPDSSEVLSESFNTCQSSSNENYKSKTIYKPKFRVGTAFYRDSNDKEKLKKSISPNADFLTEHISKIISDNEAIVDVIETPLQKKYNKIKQIAESKQFMNDLVVEIKSEPSPLNLTKSSQDIENSFRKRSHSESFSQTEHQKHPLNPEGSIIKDLLLKTKINGLVPVSGELLEGSLFICPLCQIVYRSADNLETHRLYYCKGSSVIGNNTTNERKDTKIGRPENVFFRSNSVNVRLPETSSSTFVKTSTSTKSTISRIKPDNLIIIKPESSDVIAPLPSPGPLLGNTRLVDTRLSSDFTRKNEGLKIKSTASPKRRIDCGSDMYSPRLMDNISPRSGDMYPQPKIRCIDTNSGSFRSIDEMSHVRNNSTSLQMFGGEVKIMDHSGSTTTLRIEPNKSQLSPILIQQNISASKIAGDAEASSVVVRSGLHSGGTIMHNPPTPKEVLSTPQPQTPRISISTPTVISNSNLPNIHDISTHFQFPPLSAITAFNPLTLPPLSPSSSPSGATTILHGGKLIPHVPGIPGPNTHGMFVGNSNGPPKNINSEISKNSLLLNREENHSNLPPHNKSPQMMPKYE